MRSVLLAGAMGFLLMACTTLSKEDEERLVELAQQATIRALTQEEIAEIDAIRQRAEEGTFDLTRLAELLGAAVGTFLGVNIYRNTKRKKRGEKI